MKFFLDTEFIELGPTKPIQLISIGIAGPDFQEYYAVSSEFKEADANEWVKTNVLPKLQPSDYPKVERIPRVRIAKQVYNFVETVRRHEPVEFWGYYADYDWVVFCQLFGAMVDLPKGWSMFCRDIKQLCDELGNPRLPPEFRSNHNALSDARWNRLAWDQLRVQREVEAFRDPAQQSWRQLLGFPARELPTHEKIEAAFSGAIGASLNPKRSELLTLARMQAHTEMAIAPSADVSTEAR
jgi:hypothetical protein